MWAFIWLGLLSLTVISLLVYNHFDKQREGFEGATIINQQRPNTDVSTTDLNANRGDPTCPIGQISILPGKICTGLLSKSEINSMCAEGTTSPITGQPCTGPASTLTYITATDSKEGQDALDLAGNPYGRTGNSQSEKPRSFTADIVKSTKVSQPPFPPCVGYVDEVVYAPTDTNADIANIKADLALLHKNIPNYVADGVNQQTGIIVKGMLRQQGFPLTDDTYGQNNSPLNCN
jgi:hypothetical protein